MSVFFIQVCDYKARSITPPRTFIDLTPSFNFNQSIILENRNSSLLPSMTMKSILLFEGGMR